MALEQTQVADKNPLLISHAQVWIGQPSATLLHVEQLLQRTFCPADGCNTCTSCMQIRDHQHHAIMWLAPEKTYTKEQLDALLARMAFRLEPGALFFFIIQQADFLPPAPANRLLKSLEEPPEGYHFILLAEREDQLLTTIKSRCVIQEYGDRVRIDQHPLFAFFTHDAPYNPTAFLKHLEQSKINERETIELLDALVKYWAQNYSTTIENPHTAYQAIRQLKEGFAHPPMPGSSKLFWKDMYLLFHA